MPNDMCSQSHAPAAATTPVAAQVAVVPMAGTVDDIGKYLAAMEWRKFWTLARKHRPWLTTKEFAALVGESVRQLEIRRTKGSGPVPVTKGKFVRYYIGAPNPLQQSNHVPPAGVVTVLAQHAGAIDDVAAFLAAMPSDEFWELVRKYRPRLTTKETAAYLGISRRCLESWRAEGRGPFYLQRGKFLYYRIDAVDAWMANPD